MHAFTMSGYSRATTITHWVVAALFVFMLLTGFLVPYLPDTVSYKWIIRESHESFGLLVIPLVLVRLAIRVITGAPTKSRDVPSWVFWLSRAVHIGFYVLMFTLPITGYLVALPYGIAFFSVHLINHLPDSLNALLWLSREPDFYLAGLASYAHTIMAMTLASMLALHVIGALLHHYPNTIRSHSV
ncbi:cytochrome b [Enterovibrio norvegicus]|uniref:cytochrome b n=1 Tax=Enterovibrio norvegicus TaxID=188144 RepID=UPI00354DF8A8